MSVKDDPEALCHEVIGLAEPAASELIIESGYRVRWIALGDRALPIHADRRCDRVNLYLSEDRVVLRAEVF